MPLNVSYAEVSASWVTVIERGRPVLRSHASQAGSPDTRQLLLLLSFRSSPGSASLIHETPLSKRFFGVKFPIWAKFRPANPANSTG